MGYPNRENTNSDEYDVSSLNFAAALLCLGKKVIYTKPHPIKPNLSVWVFEKDTEIQQLHRQYNLRALKVEPQQYWENVRQLKDMALNNQ